MDRVVVIAAATLVAGCGGRGALGTWPRAEGVGAPIYTASVEGRALDVPRLEALLEGEPVTLVLDSGATQHFVLAAVAWAHGLGSEEVDTDAVDSAGRRVSFRRARDGALRLPGWPAAATPYLFVVDGRALAAAGFVGGLSPQLAAPPGHAAVVDLRAGRLEVLPTERLAGPDRPSLGRTCPAGDDPRDGWHHVVPVEVAGETVPMLVDTGAARTTVYAGTAAGRAIEDLALHADALGAVDRALEPEAAGPARPGAVTAELEEAAPPFVITGVGGDIGGLAAAEVEVAFGGARQTLQVGLVEAPLPGRGGEGGILGFDLLRRCRLVLGRQGLAARCGEDDPPLHAPPRRPAPEALVLEAIEAAPACGLRADELVPEVTGSALPFRYSTPVEAYVDLQDEAADHAERITARCRGLGYLDARVRQPLLRRRGSRLRVLFHVEAGPRYRVRAVGVTFVAPDGAERAASPGELPPLATRVGEPYRFETVAADVRGLEPALEARGFHVTWISESEEVDYRARTVEVTIRVEVVGPGPGG